MSVRILKGLTRNLYFLLFDCNAYHICYFSYNTMLFIFSADFASSVHSQILDNTTHSGTEHYEQFLVNPSSPTVGPSGGTSGVLITAIGTDDFIISLTMYVCGAWGGGGWYRRAVIGFIWNRAILMIIVIPKLTINLILLAISYEWLLIRKQFFQSISLHLFVLRLVFVKTSLSLEQNLKAHI